MCLVCLVCVRRGRCAGGVVLGRGGGASTSVAFFSCWLQYSSRGLTAITACKTIQEKRRLRGVSAEIVQEEGSPVSVCHGH